VDRVDVVRGLFVRARSARYDDDLVEVAAELDGEIPVM
jgi:hypothetical protein